jgi:hypothetical protein
LSSRSVDMSVTRCGGVTESVATPLSQVALIALPPSERDFP